MPNVKLISEVLPKKNQILITNSRIPLGQEIISQLSIYSHIEVLQSPHAQDEFPDITALGVIVHLAGFDGTSLADTLDHTTGLYKLLQIAKSYQAKFVLVLPNSRNHLYHTSLTLVSQFAKNFPLSYVVIEVDKAADNSNTAYEVIKKFVYNHKLPVHKPRLAPSNPNDEKNIAEKIKKLELPKTTKKYQPPPLPKFELSLPTLSLPSFKLNSSLKYFLLIIGIIALPWIVSSILFIGVVAMFGCTQSAITSQNIKAAVRCGSINNTLTAALRTTSQLSPGFDNLALRFGYPLSEISDTSQSLSTSLQLLELAQTQGVDFIQSVIDGQPGTKHATLFNQSISQLSENFALLQTHLRAWYQAVPDQLPQLNEGARQLSQLKEVISKVQSIGESYTTFFPIDQKVTYAVILQDNTELRPSGGYIDAIVLITLEEGKLTNMELISSQAADANLKGEVASPADFKSIVGETKWFLRDSNWEVDHPSAAKQMAWFLQKELDRQIDVVISANSTTLMDWLEITGPVKIGSREVNSKNFSSEYISHLQTQTQTESFIYLVTEKLIDRVKTAKPNQLKKLSEQALASLISRQTLIYPITMSAQSLESVGWSGGVGPAGCRSQLNCVREYVYPIDTNIAANKTDYFVTKTAKLDLEIRKEAVIRKYEFNYQNRSTQTVWPSGDYKNYFRLLLPVDVVIGDVRVNGTSLPRNQYAITDKYGLKELALVHLVGPSQSGQIEITASSPVDLSAKAHFQLDIVNQPGQTKFPTSVSIVYPKEWFVTVYSDRSNSYPSVASPGLLRYNADLARGLMIDLDLAPSSAK